MRYEKETGVGYMSNGDDWRLQGQDSYLKGIVLVRHYYNWEC